jgi:DUF1680 family protein
MPEIMATIQIDMKTLFSIFFSQAVLFISLAATAQRFPFYRFRQIRLGTAVCTSTDSTLIINSGRIERTYRITSRGLCTVGLGLTEGRGQNIGASVGRASVAGAAGNGMADWDMGLNDNAKLIYMRAEIADDSGFTAKHIAVTGEFVYADAGIKLRFVIWVYPGSGIRTQIALKTVAGDGRPGAFPGQGQFPGKRQFPGQGQSDYIPVRLRDPSVTAFGYYNDTQHRNGDTTFILKEERLPPGAPVDWASGLLIRQGTEGGFILVKESHKCVNQPGVATGSFETGPGGIGVTGLGLGAADLDAGSYRKCWADWIVPYAGDSTDALLALKEFDRLRYPVRSSDLYIMANTWGDSENPTDGQHAAGEDNVLKEIASQADLGIDVQQIDDGWQGPGYTQWRPAADVYPQGWSKVKDFAAREKVKLGLWASWVIPEADLEWNFDHGGFSYVKLDFSQLNTKARLDSFMNKVRSFVQYTHNQVRINWDVTENAPRVGYFYAREFGNVWLENRKPVIPANAIYTPYRVLRDAWQVAKYVNLNKFQLPIQNMGRIDRQASNAYLYSDSYSAAIALMGSPMFFELTQFYPDTAREAVKRVVTAYKRERDDLFKGYVFPVGDMPDDSNWTGFQDVIPGGKEGYLLIFRELRNGKETADIRLRFIHDKYLELTDLLSGTRKAVFVDKGGFARFTMEKPADFRFYRYAVAAAPAETGRVHAGPGLARGSMPRPYAALSPVPFNEVTIRDSFWLPRIKIAQDVTLPLLLDIAEKQGKIDNFRIVAGRKTGKIRLYNCGDSDLYKLLEAAAYSLYVHRDKELEERVDSIIAIIAAAQQPDGYLNTQFTLSSDNPASPGRDNAFVRQFGYGAAMRWTSSSANWPMGMGQLYCAGHLMEAAVAYYLATGKKELLHVAVKLAGDMNRAFPSVAQIKNYADHPEVSIGLFKLYQVTGNRDYLKLADGFCRYLKFTRPVDLYQDEDSLPLQDQRHPYGHCVRTAYIYTGATDVVRATGSRDLMVALDSLWHNLVGTKMYIHGGTGNGTNAEQHGLPYDLPIGGTYSETCANVAQGQWNHSLNLLTGNARYADVVELESYNAALDGISLDGKKFFYSNKLNMDTTGRHDEHSGVRTTYLFCCPSKVPGFVTGIGRWIYAKDPRGLYVNLFIGSEVNTEVGGQAVSLRQVTRYPWNGDIDFIFDKGTNKITNLNIRIPSWVSSGHPIPDGLYTFGGEYGAGSAYDISINGVKENAVTGANGYAALSRKWSKGDKIHVHFDMPVKKVYTDSRVKANHGRVTLMRGPLLYSLEGVDNHFDVLRMVLPKRQISGRSMLRVCWAEWLS